MKSKTANACLAAISALDAAIKAKIEPVPEGWFTTRDVQKAKGIKESRARDIVAEGFKIGIYERKKWRFEGSIGFIYRLKK